MGKPIFINRPLSSKKSLELRAQLIKSAFLPLNVVSKKNSVIFYLLRNSRRHVHFVVIVHVASVVLFKPYTGNALAR